MSCSRRSTVMRRPTVVDGEGAGVGVGDGVGGGRNKQKKFSHTSDPQLIRLGSDKNGI